MITPAPNDRMSRPDALFAAWASRVEAGEGLERDEAERRGRASVSRPELRRSRSVRRQPQSR